MSKSFTDERKKLRKITRKKGGRFPCFRNQADKGTIEENWGREKSQEMD